MQGGVADLGACDQGAETTRAACEASNGGAGVFTSAGAPGGTGTVSAVQSCAPNGLLRHGPLASHTHSTSPQASFAAKRPRADGTRRMPVTCKPLSINESKTT